MFVVIFNITFSYFADETMKAIAVLLALMCLTALVSSSRYVS